MEKRFALASTGWSYGKVAMYVAVGTSRGTVRYSKDASKALTFATRRSAVAFRSRSERGWGWEVVAVS
jgi:hypothetical protein